MVIAGRTSYWFTKDRLHILQGAAHKGSSSLCTSLVLKESIAYVRDRGSEVMVASLDTRKAYDKVELRAYFTSYLIKDLIKIMEDFEGFVHSISEDCQNFLVSYQIHQGVRQGGVLSMNSVYKSSCIYLI